MAKPTAADDLFDLRLARSAPDLWPMLDALYGQRSIYPEFRGAHAVACPANLGITAMHDALSDATVRTHDGQIVLPPYARVWLT